MRYFLSISLEHFYAGTLLSKSVQSLASNQDPSLRSGLERGEASGLQMIIVHHEKKVLDIGPKAEEAGANIGMALSEAKALLPGATFMAWEPEPYREAQETWLDICTDISDIVEPDQQDSAYIDLTGHPDPLAIAWQLQNELKDRLGWNSRIGIAGSKWIAKVAEIVSIEGEYGSPYQAACSDPAAFLAPLKTKMLLPVPEEHRARLRFLGYRTIGEVATVPLAVLHDQFGREGLLIHQAAKGGVFQKIQALYPRDSVSVRMRFEGGLDNLESLLSALHQLAKKLAEMLLEREAQGNELIATFETEEGEQKTLRRKFMKPMQSSRAIFAGLKLLLVGCISEPIMRLRVRMTNLKPAEKFQRELSGAHCIQERESSTQAAFSHIRTVFGDQSIEIAGERKEPRRKVVMRVWKSATGWS